MEAVLQKCNGLWTEEYHKEAINILKKGYNGQKQSRTYYHIMENFQLCNLGGVDMVPRTKW